jgi:hypothetical protein
VRGGILAFFGLCSNKDAGRTRLEGSRLRLPEASFGRPPARCQQRPSKFFAERTVFPQQCRSGPLAVEARIKDSVRSERVLLCAETSHYDDRDREFENGTSGREC